MGTGKPKSDPPYTVDELKALSLDKEHEFGGFNFYTAYLKNEKKIQLKPYNDTVDIWNSCQTELNFEKENKRMSNMGEEANKGYVKRDDSKTATRLFDKNWSPLIVRKYQMNGWPLFIGIICDANLNDLDELVYSLTDKVKEEFLNGSIQGVRNYCGYLSDEIVNHYNSIKRGCAEGVIICYYVDKMFVSSAYGDLMTHEKCAAEFYSILNMMPHI